MDRSDVGPEDREGNAARMHARTVELHGDTLAVEAEGRTMTHAEVGERAAEVAGGLPALGLDPGDRVLVYLPNCPEYVVTALACFGAGTPVSPTIPQYKPRETEYQFEDTDARWSSPTPPCASGSPRRSRASTATRRTSLVPVGRGRRERHPAGHVTDTQGGVWRQLVRVVAVVPVECGPTLDATLPDAVAFETLGEHGGLAGRQAHHEGVDGCGVVVVPGQPSGSHDGSSEWSVRPSRSVAVVYSSAGSTVSDAVNCSGSAGRSTHVPPQQDRPAGTDHRGGGRDPGYV